MLCANPCRPFSVDLRHDIFIPHCLPFSGLTSNVLTDTFCGKRNSYLGLICFSCLGLGKTHTHRTISYVSSIHLCRNESGFMKFVFLKKKLFNSQTIPWPSCAFQQDLQRQAEERATKTSGLPDGELKSYLSRRWRRKSWEKQERHFYSFVARKPKPKLEFCGSGTFLCLPVILHRWFWFKDKTLHPPEGTRPSSCACVACSRAKVYFAARENENEQKMILKPSTGRQKSGMIK